MVKLTVAYGPPTDPATFDAYYIGRHVPLVAAIPGLRRNEVARVTGTLDATPAPYHLLAELYFDSQDALVAALASPQGRVVTADVANFATGTVTMLVSEVVRG
jgi:uncharacterized protein (TIGR02118 family)